MAGAVLVPALGWLLRNMTQRFDLATLVTNNVVGAGPGLGAATSSRAPAEAAPGQGEAVQGSLGLVKPALGKDWRAQAHTRLLLTRKEGVTTATLLTSSMAVSYRRSYAVLLPEWPPLPQLLMIPQLLAVDVCKFLPCAL
jgi:hypothetical protein